MNLRFKILVGATLILSFCSMLVAQDDFVADPNYVQRDFLNLEDFGFTGAGFTVPYLFTLMITVHADAATYIGQLEMQMNNDEGEFLVGGRSDEFNFPTCQYDAANQQYVCNLNITNQELFNQASPYQIKITDWDDDFLNRVLGMTRLPSDQYLLNFTFQGTAGLVLNTQVLIDISNQHQLDLISPSDGEEISMLQPMFWWESDMQFFRLFVVEDNPLGGVPNSPDEFASHPYKNLDTYILVGSNGTIPNIPSYVTVGTNNYIYPSSAMNTQHFEPLEYGKSYYWMIVGFIDPQTNLQNIRESQIFRFTIIADPSQRTLTDFRANIARDLLLGLGQSLRDQFPAGINLDVITPTGYVTINGVQVTWAQLQNLLQNARTGAIQIIRTEIVNRPAGQ